MRANRAKAELAMARACLNLTELAQKAEMPQPTVKKAVYGGNARPATLGRIAKALGVDVEDLIEE